MSQQYGQHVGLVVGVKGSTIDVVSGNSGDAVQESGYFDPTSSTVNGYAIVGYTSPIAAGTAGLRAQPLRTSGIPLSMINTQDGGR
jgi:hypothetical protein